MNPEACQDLLILSAAACSRRYPALLSPNISGNQPLRRKMRPLYIWSLESPVKALLKDPIAIHQQQYGFLSKTLSLSRCCFIIFTSEIHFTNLVFQFLEFLPVIVVAKSVRSDV